MAPTSDQGLALLDRAIADIVVDAMSSARAVALLGARQAGKSTLARLLVERHLEGAEFITLDDDRILDRATDDPIGFVAGLGRQVVIDEIQRAPRLLLAIKMRLDKDNARGQFLLTGSANLRRIPTVSDALPGRVDYLTLWPFTQGELLGGKDRFLPLLFRGEPPEVVDAPTSRGEYSELLLRGGFPEAQSRSHDDRRRFFQSYAASIVGRDVKETSRVHDPASVEATLRLVAARSGSLARFDSLGRDVGVSGATAKSYVDVLERLFLVRIRRPWHVNMGKRQVKAPKLYIADTGLLSGLAGIDAQRVNEDGGVAGSVFETFVTTELERQASWFPEALSLWHYRERGNEVDVVVERPSGDVVGIEVKAGATVRSSDFGGLARLRDCLGGRFKSGVVLYPGDLTLSFGDRLWAVPLSGLWADREPLVGRAGARG